MKTLLIAAPLFLAGCASTVSPSDMNRAIQFCASNGGVNQINTTAYNKSVNVVCANTMTVKFQTTGR